MREYVGDNEMKRILLGSVAVIALGTSAFAADLPARMYTKAPPPPPPAPIYNWTGFYIGGHIGGAFGNNDFGGPLGFVTTGDRSSFLGGVQVGGDYQFAQSWVLGIEGQFSWIDTHRDGVLATLDIHDRNRGLGSVTGRLGYSWGPGLLYVKGGAAFRDRGDLDVTILGVPTAVTFNDNDTGYTVGAGLEYMFAPNWSGKIEYQFFNFGHTSFVSPIVVGIPAGTTFTFNHDINTVKFGINYRWGGPVAAKY
jgi:outer membrane immunogenic protein